MTRLEIEITRLGDDEGARLRAIRLRALRDAPDAFATTLAEASARPPESWSEQVATLPTFVAVIDGADVGMVRCGRDQIRDGTAWLISMWVAPEARCRGAGAALVAAVVTWAERNGFERLLLDVADQNAQAIALYKRMGFAPNGIVSTLPPPRQHITEHQLELPLSLHRR